MQIQKISIYESVANDLVHGLLKVAKQGNIRPEKVDEFVQNLDKAKLNESIKDGGYKLFDAIMCRINKLTHNKGKTFLNTVTDIVSKRGNINIKSNVLWFAEKMDADRMQKGMKKLNAPLRQYFDGLEAGEIIDIERAAIEGSHYIKKGDTIAKVTTGKMPIDNSKVLEDISWTDFYYKEALN